MNNKNTWQVIGLIFMTFFLSGNVLASSFRSYKNLSSNTVTSEKYEIIKLINGDIKAVFHVGKTGEILVLSNGYIWKINKEGYLIDTFYGSKYLDQSGLISHQGSRLQKFTTVDWVYSGDRSERYLSTMVNAHGMEYAELKQYLDKADATEFVIARYRDEGEHGLALLKMKAGWLALNISDKVSKIVNSEPAEYKIREQLIWQERKFEGYRKKPTGGLQRLKSMVPYKPDWEDSSHNVFIEKFSKRYHYDECGISGRVLLTAMGYDSSTCQSRWYGDGYFKMRHGEDVFHFKAFVAKLKNEYDVDNISIYEFPNKSQSDVRFISIGYIGAEHSYYNKLKEVIKYHEKDVGFYVIRKKANKNIDNENYRTRNPWLPEFKGLLLNPGRNIHTFGALAADIKFFDSNVQPVHHLIKESAVFESVYNIPKLLSVRWDAPRLGENFAYKLNVPLGNPIWLNLNGRDSGVLINISFDESEMKTAFKLLDVKKQKLKLQINLKKINEYNGALLIELISKGKSILLKKVIVDSPVSQSMTLSKNNIRQSNNAKISLNNKNYNVNGSFERNKLKREYEKALSDSKHIKDYLKVSNEILSNNIPIEKYAEFLIYYSHRLLGKLITNKNNEGQKEIVNNFVTKILPYIKSSDELFHHKDNIEKFTSTIVISLIAVKDEKLSILVFDEVLSQSFQLNDIGNSTLLFNLSCYYSLQKDKPNMLLVMKQALLKGKPAQQFKSDSDFTFYWSDSDFLSLLE